MARFVAIGFFIMCFMFGLNLFNIMNDCYQYGNTPSTNFCPVDVAQYHAFISYSRPPLFGYDSFTDAYSQRINTSSASAWNSTISSAVEYRPAPAGLSDIFGFFSWVVTGLRLLVNVFILPFHGFPQFLTNFWVPTMVSIPVGVVLGIIQIFGVYEFATGREIF